MATCLLIKLDAEGGSRFTVKLKLSKLNIYSLRVHGFQEKQAVIEWYLTIISFPRSIVDIG